MTSPSSPWRRGILKPEGLRLCNWPGCRRPVPQNMWGCARHWFTLPPQIREAIRKAYHGDGPNPEWKTAHSEALDWIEKGLEIARKSREQVSPLPPEKPPC